METEAPKEAKVARKLVFHRVADNLFRLESSGAYYALVRKGDKQFRRSLKTRDRKLAERRLHELRAKIGNLQAGYDSWRSFDDVAAEWMKLTAHTLKPSSALRREQCIATISPFFAGITVRNIERKHCHRWLEERGLKVAPMTMNRELELMRGVFRYAMKLGLILSDPSDDLERRRVTQAPVQIPSREQFKQLVAAIRASDGRLDSQRKAKAGADLVELLAYSGCRLGEAVNLRWRDVNFDKGVITVTGGEQGTKNHEFRVVPMTDALRQLLTRLRQERPTASSDDYVAEIDSAKKCLQTTCRRLSYPQFTHHDFRHFFATTCIESGVDIPTVSRWLGHKDGGALAMKVYGHLRQDHSRAMVQKVNFSI